MHLKSTLLNPVCLLSFSGKSFVAAFAMILAGFSINAQVSISASDTIICIGDSTTLTASGGSNYMWVSPINANVDTGAVIIVAPINTFSPTTYTVVDTAADDTATIVIEVLQLPSITLSTSADLEGKFICEDSSITMTISAANGTYLWSPDSSLNSSTGSTVVGSPETNTPYTVWVTDTLTGCMDSRTVNVNVNSSYPNVSGIFSSDSLICQGDSVTMEASGASSGYIWVGPNTSSSTNTIIKAAPDTSVDYILIGRSLGCTSNDTLSVIVLPAPTISASSTPPGVICLDEEKVVTVVSSEVDFYTWIFPTQSLTTINKSVTVSPNVPGTITITVIGTDSNSCTASASVNIIVDDCFDGPAPGILENGLESGINTFFQADQDRLVVDFEYSLNQTLNVSVINILGSEVYRGKIAASAQNGPVYIDLQGAQSGIYILQLGAEDGSTLSKKFVNP